ncbi:MAG: PASTA domain-containing protein [candidate division WOR-3 bacterium]|nr:PASTA domain-containing protein [candidate division WOR-3 bacterium]MCX7947927.1 PASTA domain-containing protein [candidate division WOR-3 bacterium]MDW8150871.1 PASTA domain-containing protein [candidate division WOR-3 bacterium]
MNNFLERLFYYVLGLIVVGFILLSILNYLIMPIVVRKGDEVLVPNVVGIHIDSASKILKKYSLIPIVDTIIPSKVYPQEYVIEQNPYPKSKVKKNRKVFLVVSKGVEMIEVPDVVGMKRDEAEDIIKGLGFEVEIEYSEVKGVENDIILETFPSPKTKLPKGSKIKIIVSRETL